MTGDARPVVPSHSRLRPLRLDEVEVTGGDWARRQAVNSSATLEPKPPESNKSG